MPGMAIVDSHGVRGRILIIEDLEYCAANRAGSSWLTAEEMGRCLPDLSDPAGLGCLLALVREAWGDHVWLPTCLDAEDEAWVVDSPSRNRQTRHESYAAALVAALEAADAA
jgi:hypothetical protein